MNNDNGSESTKDKLRRAMWRPLSEDTQSSQLAAIERAVEGSTAQLTLIGSRNRIRLIAIATAILVLPSGLAIAAENSLPGDSLYPVKRATESVRSLINPDIAAEHRVEELESLVAMDAGGDDIRAQLERAEAEVALLPSVHVLRSRLDRVALSVRGTVDRTPTDRVPDDMVEAAGRDDRPSDALPPATTSTRRETTTTRRTDPTGSDVATSDSRPGSGDTAATVSTTTTVASVTTTTVPQTSTTLPPSTTTIKPSDLQLYRVSGYVHAGPVCPVERFPPDPDCADRPVEGAVLVFTNEDDKEVGRVVSDTNGRFGLQLPNGSYVLHPQPVDGLLGTAPPQRFVVNGTPVELDVAYDTGIR